MRPKPAKEGPPTTWAETIDRFVARLRERNKSENTIRSYTAELKRFGTWFEGQFEEPALLSEIQESDLPVWMESLRARGLENTSINTKLATLQSLFKWGRSKGWMDALETPDWLKLKAATCHWLEVKEEARLVRAVEKEGALRDRALITFLLRCGLRVSEAAKARISHFTLDEPDPEVEVIGKGNRPADRAATPPCRQATHEAHQDPGLFSRSRPATPMSSRDSVAPLPRRACTRS